MKFLVLAALGSLVASLALARQPPAPTPSGLVIHLFGPNSLSSNVLPTPAASAPQTAKDPAPSTTGKNILHEMFVTGDTESAAKKLSKGKPGERQ